MGHPRAETQRLTGSPESLLALPNSLPTSPAEVTGTTGEQVDAEETWLALAGSAQVPHESPLSAPHFTAFRMQTHIPGSSFPFLAQTPPTQWLQARPSLPETPPEHSRNSFSAFDLWTAKPLTLHQNLPPSAHQQAPPLHLQVVPQGSFFSIPLFLVHPGLSHLH